MRKGYKNELRVQGGSVAERAVAVNRVYNKLNTNHMISLDEFKEYISKRSDKIQGYFDKRRIIEINNAVYLMKKRFTTYVSPEANTQFISLHESNKARLKEMLNYFVEPMWAKIILVMIQHKKSDQDIFSIIKTNFRYTDTISSKMYRMAKITDAIHRCVKDKDDIDLLDVGIGNGNKTLQMRDMLRCKVSGADIPEWGPYKAKKFKFQYKPIQLSPYRIPYNNKSFDCITLILVLHHAEDMIAVLKECKRMLKPNGIVALVEHDIWSDDTNMLIDVQHRIYGAVYDEKTPYHGSYFNFYEWDMIFSKCGFKPVMMDYLTDDASNYQKYDVQYIAIYRLNE